MSKKAPADAGKGWSGPDALTPLLVPIDSLSPDPSNARRHNDRNIEAIIASLHRFGQRFPIVVQKQGMIVRAGNGRVEAMKRLGWKNVAAVVVDESSVDATAFAIADNRTAELAEWDDETLASLLQSMDGAERAVAGFTEAELGELLEKLTPDVQINEDEVPEPPVDPITKPGDLWLLGDHRLLCGDSTNADDVARLMGGEKAVAIVSDPPYGIGYDYSQHDDSDNAKNAALVAAAFANGPGFIVWTPGQNNLARDIERFGKAKVLVWFKKFAAAGNGFGGASVWEPVLAVGRPPKTGLKTDVFEIMTDREYVDGISLRDLHSCPKPVSLYGRLIDSFTNAGDLLYEPFCGSGTTLIAAEQLGRKCYGMEISPQYCDVIVKRWETLTGRKAELAER